MSCLGSAIPSYDVGHKADTKYSKSEKSASTGREYYKNELSSKVDDTISI